jgi:hypothetical protein
MTNSSDSDAEQYSDLDKSARRLAIIFVLIPGGALLTAVALLFACIALIQGSNEYIEPQEFTVRNLTNQNVNIVAGRGILNEQYELVMPGERVGESYNDCNICKVAPGAISSGILEKGTIHPGSQYIFWAYDVETRVILFFTRMYEHDLVAATWTVEIIEMR